MIQPSAVATTVPTAFVERMLAGARRALPAAAVSGIVRSAGIAPDLLAVPSTRVTRAQFTRLYTDIAIAMEDEMLGLWSRPIRPGTLKYLGSSLLDAPSLLVALYRFTRFWNLLLDDYRLDLNRRERLVTLRLVPRRTGTRATVFGHELMIKLVHGTMSWLVGSRIEVLSVGFGFREPRAFKDYASLFPADVAFDEDVTFIRFDENELQQQFKRTKGELLHFVRRAPDDWMFLTLDRTSLSQRVRDHIGQDVAGSTLSLVATALGHSTRSLSRKLSAEGTSFLGVKDGLRRDLAIERLVRSTDPIASVAHVVGFENLSAFHRAFRAWTGSTPSAYRRQKSLKAR